MYKITFIIALLSSAVFASCNPADLAVSDSPFFPDEIQIIKAQKAQEILLKRPANFNSENSYSLLIILHGNGGTAQGLASSFSLFNDQPMLIAAPQGQYPKPVSGSVGYSWYYETANKSLWESMDPLSTENIVDAIKNISIKYKVKKVFVFGFSQGASLAYTVGIKYPKLITGVAAVGGAMPEIDVKGSIISSSDISNAKDVKIFVARGIDDSLVGKNQFDNQKLFFTAKGFDTKTYEYSGGHYLTTSLLEELLSWIKSSE